LSRSFNPIYEDVDGESSEHKSQAIINNNDPEKANDQLKAT